MLNKFVFQFVATYLSGNALDDYEKFIYEENKQYLPLVLNLAKDVDEKPFAD